VTRPDGDAVKIEDVAVVNDHLILTWIEAGSVPVFEKVRWKDDDGDCVSGEVILKKARISNVVARSIESEKSTGIGYSEANSVVTSGRDVRALDTSDEEPEDSTLAERLEALEVVNGGDATISETEEGTKSKKKASAVNGRLQLSAPGTFATILRQALKTNDAQLLETCLSQRDEMLIKSSVLRLDSALAVSLLERLAEKMARQPTRAGELNFWIKWVMIAHGGYFVSLPNLLKTLSSLHATLADRVTTLPRLLALQGRLELLSSQMELRRDILSSKRIDEDSESEDESAVEYVEDGAYIANGEEDDSDIDSEEIDGPESGFIELEAEESLDDEVDEDDVDGDDDAMDEDDEELNGE
jgi:U3 small nucleolar RNA-associated protein 5